MLTSVNILSFLHGFFKRRLFAQLVHDYFERPESHGDRFLDSFNASKKAAGERIGMDENL